MSPQRQYRRLWRQYRCWAFESSPGAGSAAGSAASSAAQDTLCLPTAAVPPPLAAVPVLRVWVSQAGGAVEEKQGVQRHYRQERR